IIKIGVNWEKIRGIRIELKNWQDKLRQAQLKSKKKEIRKLKLQQGEMSERQNTILMTDLKQAILYLIPFVLAWVWLSTIYQDWVVAWLPFNLPWPDFGIRLFSGTVASMGFLGWYLLSYFGFAQIWRRFLIPSH
ncbi:hypothetical protein AKJ46_00940, partial [candidate division MSBL1 archaeon SCGC-AAA833K04]